MDSQPVTSVAASTKPLWRRVIDFPLVALVLAMLVLLVPIALLAPILQVLPLETLPSWVDAPLIALCTVAVAIAAYKLVIARLGEQPVDELPFDRQWLDAPRGALIAALLMSLIVGVAALMGAYRLEGWGGSTSLPMLLFAAGLQAGIFEEILARGVLFRFLEQFGGSWFALALSSALFGLGHLGNDNATVFSSLSIAVEAGVMLGGAYMLTRNLWLAIGLHFGWNFAQGYIWDVPVSGFQVDGLVESYPAGPVLLSGGPFGLEASVIALALATPLGMWFVYRAVRAGNLVQPWWVRRRLARQNQMQTSES
ncbi:CPBP family intramembrane glutamic endopeptidase [Altererythrobacter sp. TH136]|uniref:CPBP family intramembrane glutamic endopeptidase n=1 Tax=Altererythrobacter sp. TH136 TaxID=2067415 RepID=UPI001162D2F4|nr:CPBP family intramembrane glutamic endopeptidase [Altererythrobacter sp. TH136]QDM40259.1 CPBP family intramembrane metalloprotease [Altererythrobacter sp. TH136]